MDAYFLDRTAPSGDCIVWQRATNKDGYGILTAAGRFWHAHRYSWFVHNGPIPDGLQIHHACSTKACVNPAHLMLVTTQENSAMPDGVHSLMRAKTHCPHGHAYTPENTRLYRGKRHCRTCARLRSAARYAAR